MYGCEMLPPESGRRGRCGAPQIIACLLLVLAPSALQAQAISGRFVDATTQDGIASVRVEVRRADGILIGAAASDGQGVFRVELREGGGPLRLEFDHIAYDGPGLDSLFVGADEILALPAVLLEPSPILLDSLIARAPSAPWVTLGEEWIRRNQILGRGTFLAGAIIEIVKPASLTEHIAASAGLSVITTPGGYKSLWYPQSRNGRNCIEVMLNRWPLLYPIDYIPLAGVAAVEIYRDAADVPQAYAWDHNPTCGVVNIWLRNSWR
jgi:hypothetical protein